MLRVTDGHRAQSGSPSQFPCPPPPCWEPSHSQASFPPPGHEGPKHPFPWDIRKPGRQASEPASSVSVARWASMPLTPARPPLPAPGLYPNISVTSLPGDSEVTPCSQAPKRTLHLSCPDPPAGTTVPANATWVQTARRRVPLSSPRGP